MVQIIRWADLFLKGVLSGLKRKEVKYFVSLLYFLEANLLTISSSLPSPLPLLLASSAMSNSNFSANLVIELVLLPTVAYLAMSDGKFLADVVVIVLSIEVSGSALLKP